MRELYQMLTLNNIEYFGAGWILTGLLFIHKIHKLSRKNTLLTTSLGTTSSVLQALLDGINNEENKEGNSGKNE